MDYLPPKINFTGESTSLLAKCTRGRACHFFGDQFKLPKILKTKQSALESIGNVETFDCNAATSEKGRLWQDSFGDVYTTECGAAGNVVVVKEICSRTKRNSSKLEVALLYRLSHPNVVKLLGVCHQPVAILLEYNLNLFGEKNLRVSSLSDFLSIINNYNCTQAIIRLALNDT